MKKNLTINWLIKETEQFCIEMSHERHQNKAFLMDRNLPVDEIELEEISNEILENPPSIGYLTISNALQWRLQYSRVISLQEQVSGVVKIYDSQFPK